MLITTVFFLEIFFDHLLEFEREEIIMGGDFNLVFNIDIDIKGRLAMAQSKPQEIVIMPPRFFLVSQCFMCYVTGANISAGYKTDHSLTDMKIALHSNPRDPGYWKLNTSFK